MASRFNKISLGNLQKLGLADIQTGPFGTVLKASEFSDFGVPVISTGEIREGFVQLSQRTPFVSEEITNRLPQFVLELDDIVFGRKGAIDRNAIIKGNQVGWFLGSDGIRLRLSKDINSAFVSYQLRLDAIGKWLLQNSTGSTMPSLNQKILDRLPLWLPPICIQDDIASILSSIDAKIEVNNKINAELEAMAKLIYDYWFVQFDFPYVTSSGVEKPYKSSGGKMVYNAELKREIPEGWEDGVFEDVADVIGGSTPSKANSNNFIRKTGTPWITPKDLSNNKGRKYITRGEFDVTDLGIKKGTLKLMPPGTILLSSRAPIGYLAIARETVTTNQGFKSFVPKSYFTTEFLYYQIKNKIPLIEARSGGSTFKEVSASTLKLIKIVIPPKTIIEAYQKINKPIFNKQNLLEKENQKLSELRDWLLPMLMNGQVTISNDKLGITNAELENGLGMVAEEGGACGK